MTVFASTLHVLWLMIFYFYFWFRLTGYMSLSGRTFFSFLCLDILLDLRFHFLNMSAVFMYIYGYQKTKLVLGVTMAGLFGGLFVWVLECCHLSLWLGLPVLKRSLNIDLCFLFSNYKFHSSERKPSILNAFDFLF